MVTGHTLRSTPPTAVDLTVAATVVVIGAAIATVAPSAVLVGTERLAAHLILGLGAWLTIGRQGAIDLSVAGSAGAGALVAGIGAGQLDVPALAALPVAALVGAAFGGLAGVLAGRVGRWAGALATLCLGIAVPAVARAVQVAGGRSGFHAVPLLTGGDRTSVAFACVVAALLGVGVVAVAGRPVAARAAVAVAAPHVSRSFGRRPEVDAALVSSLAGAVLGIGGLLLVASSGSVVADGFGADTLATIALVAVLAERARRLPITRRLGTVGVILLATAAIHAPGIVFPLAPWIGTVSPLASTGLVALLVLAVLPASPPTESGGTLVAPGSSVGEAEPVHPGPVTALAMDATGLAVPAGTVELTVGPGEVVAIVGPNGAGKSTVLARIGGQLPDGGGVRLGDRPAPRGDRARAQAGVGRAWQRPVGAEPADVLATAGGDVAAAAWARDVLGEDGDVRVRAALVGVAARRPGLVLLDEPAALLPADRVAAYVRGLADAGAAVVLAEHRQEVIDVADRVVEVSR